MPNNSEPSKTPQSTTGDLTPRLDEYFTPNNRDIFNPYRYRDLFNLERNSIMNRENTHFGRFGR
ncbi:hypothetical protein [Peribacillus simplex]|uniref:Uncharacterized protein n=1 Tax=Peribacillus simplex TaxID=1478 RepID=A0AAW7IBV5_9BACI|nr:hypothetical protein [Peribacillus simplex]MDM5451029.1 hypothetical protein [Peribacillus simplex]